MKFNRTVFNSDRLLGTSLFCLSLFKSTPKPRQEWNFFKQKSEHSNFILVSYLLIDICLVFFSSFFFNFCFACSRHNNQEIKPKMCSHSELRNYGSTQTLRVTMAFKRIVNNPINTIFHAAYYHSQLCRVSPHWNTWIPIPTNFSPPKTIFIYLLIYSFVECVVQQ